MLCLCWRLLNFVKQQLADCQVMLVTAAILYLQKRHPHVAAGMLSWGMWWCRLLKSRRCQWCV